MVQRFPEAFVAQMSRVENDAKPIHFSEEFAAPRTDATGRIGALRVSSRTIVRRTNSAQALLVRSFEQVQLVNGIGAFEAQNIADRTCRWILQMFFQRCAISDLDHLPVAFHR